MVYCVAVCAQLYCIHDQNYITTNDTRRHICTMYGYACLHLYVRMYVATYVFMHLWMQLAICDWILENQPKCHTWPTLESLVYDIRSYFPPYLVIFCFPMV